MPVTFLTKVALDNVEPTNIIICSDILVLWALWRKRLKESWTTIPVQKFVLFLLDPLWQNEYGLSPLYRYKIWQLIIVIIFTHSTPPFPPMHMTGDIVSTLPLDWEHEDGNLRDTISLIKIWLLWICFERSCSFTF